MIKIILTTLFIINVAYAAYQPFQAQTGVSSAHLNNNFTHIKEILATRNTPISFSEITPGTLITKEIIENEVDKIRELGITIDPISSNWIKSEELNNLFNQMISASSSYDDIPFANASSSNAWEDLVLNGSVTYTNNYGPSNITITKQPTNGSLNIQANGSYSYTPTGNYVGSDSFKYTISDNSNTSNEATVNLQVQERFGLQKLTNYRNYKNNKAAVNCEEYLQNPNQQYEYDDDIGSGVYQVDSDGDGANLPTVQYCNMDQRGSLINTIQISMRSVTFTGSNNGYSAHLDLNGQRIAVNGGRGWVIVVFNKNFEYLYNTRYDTYGSATNATNMRNALNALPVGSIVGFITNDEPQLNVYNNTNLRTAIANFGCGSVNSVGERFTYICMGMKSSSGAILLGGPQIGNASVNYRDLTFNINWLSQIVPY